MRDLYITGLYRQYSCLTMHCGMKSCAMDILDWASSSSTITQYYTVAYVWYVFEIARLSDHSCQAESGAAAPAYIL